MISVDKVTFERSTEITESFCEYEHAIEMNRIRKRIAVFMIRSLKLYHKNVEKCGFIK